MGTYLVERYLAGWSPEAMAELVVQIAQASDRFAASHVTHLDSIVIGEDETCLCLFESATIEAVLEANADLDLPVDRVVAVTVLGDASNTSS